MAAPEARLIAPITGRILAGPRVRVGDIPTIYYRASDAPDVLVADIEILHDSGNVVSYSWAIDSFTTDRTNTINYPGKNVTNRQIATRVQGPGTILAAHVGGNFSGVNRGEFYARIGIERGAFIREVAKGYVHEQSGLFLGQNVEAGPEGGRGFVRSIDLGDPAAGAVYATQTVPSNAMWLFTSFVGSLVTDVNAASRFVRIFLRDGTSVIGAGISHYSQAANTTQENFGSIGGPAAPQLQANVGTRTAGIALPNLYLMEGYTIQVDVESTQAGDNWGDGQMSAVEWLVP